MFADRYRLKRNWLKGFCTVRTFEGHSQGKDDKTTNFYLLFMLLSLALCLFPIPTGISCVQFDDTRIVSGSWDKTIKVGATYFWQIKFIVFVANC